MSMNNFYDTFTETLKRGTISEILGVWEFFSTDACSNTSRFSTTSFR